MPLPSVVIDPRFPLPVPCVDAGPPLPLLARAVDVGPIVAVDVGGTEAFVAPSEGFA